MGKILLLGIAVFVVVIVGGAGVLAMWDIPAPTTPVDHAIPDARLPS